MAQQQHHLKVVNQVVHRISQKNDFQDSWKEIDAKKLILLAMQNAIALLVVSRLLFYFEINQLRFLFKALKQFVETNHSTIELVLRLVLFSAWLRKSITTASI